jgi:ArsR family transcriptional regulator
MGGFTSNSLIAEPPSIFSRLSTLGDPVRCRLLLLLEGQELTVSEICSVLQLPQSTVSRHLKILADDGWIGARREGTSRRYSLRSDSPEASARRLWLTVREEVGAGPAAAQDRQRLEGVLAQRRTKSQEFFSATAGEWAELRQELFGHRFDLHSLLALLDDGWVVGDLGCGTGQITQSVAPFVRRVIAVDESDAMLAAAGQRLITRDNVELRQGHLEALPIEDGALDAAFFVLVLHHLAEPSRALAEAARTLCEGGRLLVVDMLPHEREEYRQQMGHVWLGFDEDQLSGWLTEAGFERVRSRALPADPAAKGPTLFAASARKTAGGHRAPKARGRAGPFKP